VELVLTSSAPVAYLSTKVCDVFPDGTSALVTRGLLNLTHRQSSTAPVPLEPGQATSVRIELEATSWVFEGGHRVRLSLAGADWPNVWSPPERATLTVDGASLVLRLPILEGETPVAERPRFAPGPGRDPHAPDPADEQPPTAWRVERDVLGREARAVIAHGAAYHGELGSSVEESYEGAIGVSTTDRGSAWARARSLYVVRWPEADCATEARLDLRSDSDSYHVAVHVAVEELSGSGIGRRERRFERVIPRRLQ
jgi:hypothetical protein